MPDDQMIYMIGEPGAGKSTLMARLTEPWERFVATGQPRRDLLLEGETVTVDAGYVRDFSRAHEDAGFDRVLIGYSASAPDGFAVAAAALHQTERLKVLIAHRPGFVSPTLAECIQTSGPRGRAAPQLRAPRRPS